MTAVDDPTPEAALRARDRTASRWSVLAGGFRWWWWMGALATGGWSAFLATMLLRPAGRDWLMSSALGVVPLLVSVAWLCTAAPVLEAHAPRFTERWTGRRRVRLCRVFAWAPAALFVALLLQFGVVHVTGIEHHGWYTGRYGLAIAAALAIALVHGRLLSGRVERRIRLAAAASGVCYRCGYLIDPAVGPQCPECGEPARPS